MNHVFFFNIYISNKSTTTKKNNTLNINIHFDNTYRTKSWEGRGKGIHFFL